MTNTIKNLNRIKPDRNILSRRDFLNRTMIITGAGLVMIPSCNGEKMAEPPENYNFAFGVITDLHYADKETVGNRYYRESEQKLKEAIATYNSLKPAFLVELGDFIDKAEKITELEYLKTINGIYKSFDSEEHYVLGNHDVATFSKEEFIANSGARKNYYSFDHGDSYHFVILDGNYNKDGSDYNAGNFDWTETYIHKPQQEWLARDLKQAQGKFTIVFVHQNLHDEDNPHGVKNAPEVRQILEAYGNVQLVLQGHDHSGAFARINGIPYVTLKAAVEGSTLANNAFAMVYIGKNGDIFIRGFGKQDNVDV
ncbi:MAG: metallophosphoesterase [Candidatus Latescibacteria bacterium]|nr:metallophosphoesterase [Candidatus Latescibacterota bacterium]